MQFQEEEKKIIQDHYRNPRHKKHLGKEEQNVVLDNPSCGDRIALCLEMKGEAIRNLLFDGEGCSLSMASASMLTDMLIGKSLKEARLITDQIQSIFRGETPANRLDSFGDIAALKNLIDYPVRKKCATLAWETMDLLLENLAL
jgi:nitrogen fixation NifU-like protein